MPTTSNFGWTTPADTDLVKDGAAAIRTLGNGIDTSLVDLKGGTTGQVLSKNSNTDLDYTWVTPNVGDITEVQAGTGISVASGTGPIPVVTNSMATEITAKGDLIVGTGSGTFDNLPVGTNGHTLVADSSTATGLKWAAPGGKETWTLLNTGGTSLTGATTITVSGISDKDRIMVYVVNGSSVNAASFSLRLNGDTATNYGYLHQRWNFSPTYADGNFVGEINTADNNIPFGTTGAAANNISTSILINGAATSGVKIIEMFGAMTGASASNICRIGGAFYTGTSAISSVSVISNSGNWDNGTVFVYAA